MSGTKPAPSPWILCAECCPPDSTALSSGSTATTRSACPVNRPDDKLRAVVNRAIDAARNNVAGIQRNGRTAFDFVQVLRVKAVDFQRGHVCICGRGLEFHLHARGIG